MRSTGVITRGARAAAAAAALLAVAGTAGCGEHAYRAAADLAARARNGLSLAATLRYRTVSNAGASATVVLAVARPGLRVEVNEPGLSAQLFLSPDGGVACRVAAPAAPACRRVAAAGARLPATADPGAERIVGADLDALTALPAGVQVLPGGTVPATGGLPAARCFSVQLPAGGLPPAAGGDTAAAPVSAVRLDAGQYCLSAGGLPVRLRFPAGEYTLLAVGPPPDTAGLLPPVPGR